MYLQPEALKMYLQHLQHVQHVITTRGSQDVFTTFTTCTTCNYKKKQKNSTYCEKNTLIIQWILLDI
jgi:hypothetical protein